MLTGRIAPFLQEIGAIGHVSRAVYVSPGLMAELTISLQSHLLNARRYTRCSSVDKDR